MPYNHVMTIPLPPLTPRILKRFWSKIDKGKPNQCWIWTAALAHGYGRFGMRCEDGKHRLFNANRVALSIHLGRDIGNQWALHTCDTPGCCNPRHLYVGDQVDNMRDTVQRGRHYTPFKENRYTAKLTEADVQIIRELRGMGVSYPRLGRIFSVSKTCIRQAVLGRVVNPRPLGPELGEFDIGLL